MAQDLLVNLSDVEKCATVEKIHNLIRDGTFGDDYTIIPRSKNRQLRKDYNIDDDKIKEILLQLQTGDMIKAERSNHELHPNDIVYVFKKNCLLMPRWREEADFTSVVLYIKITWPVENEGTYMLVISFHEDDI